MQIQYVMYQHGLWNFRHDPTESSLTSPPLPNLSYTDYTYSDHNEIRWNLSLDIKYTVSKNCITARQHCGSLMCIWCIEKIPLITYWKLPYEVKPWSVWKVHSKLYTNAQCTAAHVQENCLKIINWVKHSF